jgi:pimeloyl-ACP methyl ester carboxylesterase
MTAEDLVLSLTSGELTGKTWGRPGSPLVICLPGFSQDERSYDAIGPALAADHYVVALALRGRGRSRGTASATWGAPSHAKDVLEVASHLGYDQLALVGWSFGGLVSMHVAQLAPGQVTSVVLIDVAGTPDAVSMAAVGDNQTRLSMTFPTEQAYLDHVLGAGMFEGAEGFFRDYLEGELEPVEGGFRTRTTPDIAQDAVADGITTIDGLWKHLTMPVLLLRAARPIVPGSGYIVPETERDRFLAAVPTAQAVEIDANHGAIGVVDAAVSAVAGFLGER